MFIVQPSTCTAPLEPSTFTAPLEPSIAPVEPFTAPRAIYNSSTAPPEPSIFLLEPFTAPLEHSAALIDPSTPLQLLDTTHLEPARAHYSSSTLYSSYRARYRSSRALYMTVTVVFSYYLLS